DLLVSAGEQGAGIEERHRPVLDPLDPVREAAAPSAPDLRLRRAGGLDAICPLRREQLADPGGCGVTERQRLRQRGGTGPVIEQRQRDEWSALLRRSGGGERGPCEQDGGGHEKSTPVLRERPSEALGDQEANRRGGA